MPTVEDLKTLKMDGAMLFSSNLNGDLDTVNAAPLQSI